jgi:hypothetical protein
MKKIIFLFWIASYSALNIYAQEKTNQHAIIPKLDYCEIIKNPTIYNEKIVEIFGEHYAALSIHC